MRHANVDALIAEAVSKAQEAVTTAQGAVATAEQAVEAAAGASGTVAAANAAAAAATQAKDELLAAAERGDFDGVDGKPVRTGRTALRAPTARTASMEPPALTGRTGSTV